MGPLPDIDCESPVGTASLVKVVLPEIHHAEHRWPVPLELLPSFFTGPQSFAADYGHFLDAYMKCVVNEFPDMTEGRVGDDVRREGLVIREEVVARLDIGLDNIDGPGGNKKSDLVGNATVPGARLPDIMLWKHASQKFNNHYPNNT